MAHIEGWISVFARRTQQKDWEVFVRGKVIQDSPIPFQQLRTGTGWPDTSAFLDAPVRK